MCRLGLVPLVFVAAWMGGFWLLQPFGTDDQMRPDGDEVWYNALGWTLPYDSAAVAAVLSALMAVATALVVGVVAAWWDGRRPMGDLIPPP